MKFVECPCGGAAPGQRPDARAPRYDACCGRFIEGGEIGGEPGLFDREPPLSTH